MDQFVHITPSKMCGRCAASCRRCSRRRRLLALI